MERIVSMLLRCAWLADTESGAHGTGGKIIVCNIMQADIALGVLNSRLLLLSLDSLGGGANHSTIAKLTLNQPMGWFLAVLSSFLALLANVVITILTRTAMIMCASDILLAKVAEDYKIHWLEQRRWSLLNLGVATQRWASWYC
jgi:hypothetical protein